MAGTLYDGIVSGSGAAIAPASIAVSSAAATDALSITPGSNGNGATLTVSGPETNVSLTIQPKGPSGGVYIQTPGLTDQLLFQTSTGGSGPDIYCASPQNVCHITLGSRGDGGTVYLVSQGTNSNLGIQGSNENSTQILAGGSGNTALQINTNGSGVINIGNPSGTNNVVTGKQAAGATTDTTGHLLIPFCAGAPTGVPTGASAGIALRYDTTNHKLWCYDNGTSSWKGVALT